MTLGHDAFAPVTLIGQRGIEKAVDDALLNRVWLGIDEIFQFRPRMEFFQIVAFDLADSNRFIPCAITWRARVGRQRRSKRAAGPNLIGNGQILGPISRPRSGKANLAALKAKGGLPTVAQVP